MCANSKELHRRVNTQNSIVASSLATSQRWVLMLMDIKGFKEGPGMMMLSCCIGEIHWWIWRDVCVTERLQDA